MDYTMYKCLLSNSLSENCICFGILLELFLITQFTNRTLPTTNSSMTAAEPEVTPIIIVDMSEVSVVCVHMGVSGNLI